MEVFVLERVSLNSANSVTKIFVMGGKSGSNSAQGDHEWTSTYTSKYMCDLAPGSLN